MPVILTRKDLKLKTQFQTWVKTILKQLLKLFTNVKYKAKLRGLMSKHDLEKLIHAFISSRADYCNGLFTGLAKKDH